MTVAAITRGTTSRWIGSMPSTSIASISSRMVRAPRSAQMAVEPAPATTSTVVSGPSWVTAPIAAPAPDRSAAPNWASSTLSVKISSTVSGIETMMVGRNRDPHDEPALQDQLAPLEWPAEQRPAGQHAHPEEPADQCQRRLQLVADIADQVRTRGCRHDCPFTSRDRACRGAAADRVARLLLAPTLRV